MNAHELALTDMMKNLYSNFVVKKTMELKFYPNLDENTRQFHRDINYDMKSWIENETTEKHLKNFMLSKTHRKIDYDRKTWTKKYGMNSEMSETWIKELNINGGKFRVSWTIGSNIVEFKCIKNSRQKTILTK